MVSLEYFLCEFFLRMLNHVFSSSGDIFHVYALGSHMIFLNTAQAIQDCFVKRSLNYADRPLMPMITDLSVTRSSLLLSGQYLLWLTMGSCRMGWDWAFSTMKYGEEWKEHRRMFDSRFKESQVSSYWPIIKETLFFYHGTSRTKVERPRNPIIRMTPTPCERETESYSEKQANKKTRHILHRKYSIWHASTLQLCRGNVNIA